MSIRDRAFPFIEDYPEAKADLGLRRSMHLPLRWKCSQEDTWQAWIPGKNHFASHSEELVFDFGSEMVGAFSCCLGSPQGGTVCVFYGECLQEALCDHPSTAGWFTMQRDEWTLASEPQEYRPAARRAFRFVRIKLPPGTTLSDPKALLEHYPVTAEGTFECSDPLLNQAWDISKRTTLLCMQHYYEDGVKRDGMLWLGDYRVQYLCNAYAFGDAALARKSLFIAAASQCEDGSLLACSCVGGGHQHPHRIDCMPGIPFRFQVKWDLLNYSADFLCGLREYVLFTGDTAILDRLWPCIDRLLGHFASVDWYAVEPFADFITDNCNPASGNGYHSKLSLWFLMHRALVDLDQLYAWAAHPEATRALGRKVRAPISSLLASLSRDAGGLFPEPGSPPSSPPEHSSWHTTSMAALSGYFEENSSRQIIAAAERAPDLLPTYAGFARFYQHWAQFEHGDAIAALDSLRRTYAPVLEAGLTTTPESLREDYSFLAQPMEKALLTSLCHGWSAGPCFFLPHHVLGIKPLAPGFGRVKISPQLGDLAWARGTIPTPLGEIVVEWEKKGDETIGKTVLPQGVEAIP